ncbi:hypothetical protein PVAND_003068 [Polypedilum vanderplanki]|uniref:Uncharacterized protein n=1 Tax=Polypedilum vanderplanki TaxID=319348 RepID=A0A9J6BTF1_POLVA|nr:hypothetical protein PVAND_003068 [Polypedilum vanderplanki]
MSASESRTFLRLLPLIMGSMIPKNNKYWMLILELVDLGDLIITMMTFVYESKNREVKSYAKVTNQRINIAQSLGFKASMRFNNFFVGACRWISDNNYT